MGGRVSKDKFVNDEGEPLNFFRLSSYPWICGGSAPYFHESLDFLKKQHIGLIVTLTISPLVSGRNINHMPYDFGDIEWTDSDDIDLSSFNLLHIPIADAGFLTDEMANKLINELSSYHTLNPSKGVYFHCWAGKGRTSLAIIYILMKMMNISYKDADEMVRSENKGYKLSLYQRNYLSGESITEEEKKVFEPIIKTPPNHACYLVEKK
jgi:protein tyrosine/serine phosphatase